MTTGINQDKLLTINEVKEILKVERSAIYGYINDGKLKAHRLGATGGKYRRNRYPFRIWEADLLEFIDSGKFTLPKRTGVVNIGSESSDK